ncbi:MAG TPA: adenosylcobinamide-GDP ribazoletransferase [Solirubrobacterales bacterium]|nr:adenosylcobinamide-GDP ribazoletransferase [Solirubrobacterales bacterium]
MREPDRLAGAPLAAVSFLTTLPLGRRCAPDGDALLRGAPLFPLVGATLGAAIGAAALALAQVMPPLLAGLLVVALELLLTGALHADGLADSADGLGGRDRARSLAIMRDHSLGAYGASALALDLGVKATALATLAEADALAAIVAALAISRAAPLPLAHFLPYAREGGGAGQVLAGRIGTRSLVAGATLAIAVAVLAVGAEALPLLLCAVTVSGTIGLLAGRRLHGVTGDVFGAAVELSATCCLVVAVALRG